MRTSSGPGLATGIFLHTTAKKLQYDLKLQIVVMTHDRQTSRKLEPIARLESGDQP